MSIMHQSGYMPKDRNSNRILIDSQLGKAKPSTYNLPHESFIYGTGTPQDPQKANQLMYNWKMHQGKDNKNINKHKDFIQTNRKCVKSLLHTASDFSNFRKSNVEYKKVKQGSKMININLPEEDFTYGKPLDLEDPIKLVLANNYGQLDKMARHSFYLTQKTNKSEAQKRKLSCHITKNHYLLKQAAKKKLQKFNWHKNEPSLWKLSRFEKVAPRTNANNGSRPFSAVKA